MSPKDVLELGRTIVRQFKLQRRGEVLTRWMAHHLAELIETAENSGDTAKQDAEDRAVELILKLWTNRRDLPVPADPLSEYRDAIMVLGRMLPSADPWLRFRRTGADDELLHDMFGAMAQLVMSGLLLTREAEMRAIEDVERKALSEEETFLLDTLNRWQRFFVTPAPSKIDLEFLYAEALNDKSKGAGESETSLQEEETEPDRAAVHRAAVLTHVETFQARLVDLLEQWRRKIMSGDDTGDAVGQDDDEN